MKIKPNGVGRLTIDSGELLYEIAKALSIPDLISVEITFLAEIYDTDPESERFDARTANEIIITTEAESVSLDIDSFASILIEEMAHDAMYAAPTEAI